MAVTGTNLMTSGATANASPYLTSSISPAANTLILAWIVNSNSAATPTTPTLAGNGLTWIEVATVTFDTIAAPRHRLTLFRAMGASPTTGQVTITISGANLTGCAWSIAQFSGVNTTGTNGSGAITANIDTANGNGVTTLTGGLTLGAFGSVTNATAAGFALDTQNAVTPEGTWTELQEFAYNTPATRIQSQWIDSNDTSPSASWTTSDAAGIALELVDAPVAARAQVSWIALEVPEATGPLPWLGGNLATQVKQAVHRAATY